MKLILPGYARDLPYYDLRLDRAENYPPHLALHPEPGPQAPVFAARIRMPAPYQDVQVVLPIRPEAVLAYQRGDRSVLPTLMEELVSCHRRVLRELRS